MLDGFCAEIGRDPDEITRSVIAFGPSLASSPFVSVQSFEDFVEQYREAGMNEFIFYYPASEWYPQSPPEQDAVFERVVAEVIPRLRAEV